jgi:hypothetical protein
MKTITNKTQKTFEAAIRMVMIKEGKSFQEAQNIVLEVVNDFKKPNVTKSDLKELIACLEMTFLGKKPENVISNLLK